MKEHTKIISALLIGSIVTLMIIISVDTKSPLPDISYNERWGDLNNKESRNAFCSAMGYESGKVIEFNPMGGSYETDRATNPYSYNIICTKYIPEKEEFTYEQYKRWMLNIALNNK